MTVWGDVKALYGEGGLEVITAVNQFTIRTIIQPDADSITWMPDPTRSEVNPVDFFNVWQLHTTAVAKRLAWIGRLSKLIQKGGLVLIPLPVLLSVIFNVAQGTLDQLWTYAIGVVSSTILIFLRRQLTELVARVGGRFLQGRLQQYTQKFLGGAFTPANYGMET